MLGSKVTTSVAPRFAGEAHRALYRRVVRRHLKAVAGNTEAVPANGATDEVLVVRWRRRREHLRPTLSWPAERYARRWRAVANDNGLDPATSHFDRDEAGFVCERERARPKPDGPAELAVRSQQFDQTVSIDIHSGGTIAQTAGGANSASRIAKV